jgi:flagellin-like protein
MQFAARKAVSPIIATLLLIAIAVAAGIIVYVFVNSISGNLTQQGGQQVSEQISMDAYTYLGANPTLVLRNVGSTSIVVNQVYVDGNLCQASGNVCTAAPTFNNAGTGGGTCTAPGATVTCGAGQYSATLLTIAAQTSGTSHLIRVVTADGGAFTFSIIAGRSG